MTQYTFQAAAARAATTDFYRHLAGDGKEASDLPLTRRADLVRDQLAHPPFGTRRFADAGAPVRVGMTGTGDDLLVVPWSEHDLALERRAGTRMLQRFGIAATTVIANTLPGALAAPGSLLWGDVVEEHGALDVPLGAIESDAAAKQAWDLIERVTPAVLCLETATAARFFAAAPAAERPWLKGLIWLRRGAVRVERREVPAALRFAGWQRTWLAVAEATNFTASTCSAEKFHADESAAVEIIDADAGGAGTLLLTRLDGGSALLRFDTGLRVRLLAAGCSCGRSETAFELS